MVSLPISRLLLQTRLHSYYQAFVQRDLRYLLLRRLIIGLNPTPILLTDGAIRPQGFSWEKVTYVLCRSFGGTRSTWSSFFAYEEN